MQCFILAGGFATRLWPITERRAKPLLPLAGKPILTYLVEAVPKEYVISVSTNAVFAEDMKAWAKTIKERSITIVIEDAGHEGEKLGALGAVAKWITERKVNEDLLLLAGDNYVGAKMEDFLKQRRDKPLIAAHDIGDPTVAMQFGTVLTENDPGHPDRKIVTDFEEKPLQPKSTCVSTGWWWLPRSTLGIVQEYAAKRPDNVGGVFEEFLKRGIGVDCFVFKEIWKDIGSFEAYMQLHREVIGAKALVHPKSAVSPDSELLGANDIGPDVTIRKSSLTDCIIFGDAVITDCVLERCIIDEHCSLTGIDLTDKMLRSGTTLRPAR